MKDKENMRRFNADNLRACQLKQLSILKEIDKVCRQLGTPYWLDGGTLLGAVRHGGFIPWDDDIDIAMDEQDLKRFVREAQPLLPDYLFVQTPDTDPQSKEPIIKVRDLNSLYIERGDHFQSDYVKGIYVDIFPFTKHPDIPRSWIRRLGRGISKSHSILHHSHTYSLRAAAEFFWFGAMNVTYRLLWNLLSAVCKSTRYANTPIINGYGITHERTTVLPLSMIRFEDSEFPAPHDPDRYLTNIYGKYMEIPPEDKRQFHSLLIIPELVSNDSAGCGQCPSGAESAAPSPTT